MLSCLAPSIAQDMSLRLLATTTLYEIEQMSGKPRSLARRIDECCTVLNRDWAAPVLKDIAGASRGFAGHTESSELSLPAWLHHELARSTQLRSMRIACWSGPTSSACASIRASARPTSTPRGS